MPKQHTLTNSSIESAQQPSPEPEQPGALLYAYLDSKRRVYPAHYNRASAIGHPCERYLVYMRTAWQEASPPDIRLQGIFEFGKDYEQLLRKRLTEAGYMFRVPYRPEVWHNLQLSGTNDGDISWDEGRTWHTIEIKGLHPYFFGRVSKWDDFLHMGPIYSKYPAQCQIYMLLNNIEDMYFLIGCKGTYDVKFLPIPLEYEFAEKLLKKIERVNTHVAAGTLPDKLEDMEACDLCEYREHCLPDTYYGPGAWITNEADFVELLDERDVLAAEKSRADAAYRKVDQRFKRLIGDKPIIMAGDYQVTQKVVHKRPQEASSHMRITVRKVSEPAEPEPGAAPESGGS